MAGADDQQDQYVRDFRERLLAMRRPGREVIEGPGLVGLLGAPGATDGRVLVTDDRALELLSARLTTLNALVVNVFSAARGCQRLLVDEGKYRQESCTAMICADLTAVPEPALPPALSLHEVGDVGACRVPLEKAAAAALRSDASVSPVQELDGFVDYLRSVPNARFLAATDERGEVRATAATATFGRSAGVFFVNTDPAWRRRGVGTAMTAAALRAALAGGARASILDASALGHSIYRRLGFAAVSPNTLFVRTA
jgi:GNAT superfamily N-acetyltransferase